MLFSAVLFSLEVGTSDECIMLVEKTASEVFHTRHSKISLNRQGGEPAGVQYSNRLSVAKIAIQVVFCVFMSMSQDTSAKLAMPLIFSRHDY